MGFIASRKLNKKLVYYMCKLYKIFIYYTLFCIIFLMLYNILIL